MTTLPPDVMKAIKRIQQLTVIKDEPEETQWDALYKIGDIAVGLLREYDEFWKRSYQEKIAPGWAEEIEREIEWRKRWGDE